MNICTVEMDLQTTEWGASKHCYFRPSFSKTQCPTIQKPLLPKPNICQRRNSFGLYIPGFKCCILNTILN